MIKAVIFDMDGVIIDSEMGYLEMALEFARTKNPSVRLEDLFGMVGSSREDSWCCMERAVHNGQTWRELRDEYHAHRNIFEGRDYRKIYRPVVTEILTQLKDAGYQLAVASSTQMEVVRHVLEVNGILHFFETVVSGAQFKRSKPDPEIYHYTADALGVAERECFVVEDSTFGVTAAHRAGMKVAALRDDRFDFDQSLADYHIEQLTDILPILLKDGAEKM